MNPMSILRQPASITKLNNRITLKDSYMTRIPSDKKLLLTSWLICGVGALYYCYEYFLRICPSVMTPELMRVYGLTGAQVGNLSAFYYHAYMPMQILVGLLMDRFAPRRLLTIACFLCAIGTYLFAGTSSLAMAEAGRFLVGFGSAFAFVGALKLATIWLSPNRFALISGIIMCLGMTGAMMGDVLLRSLVDDIGWQQTIYLSAAAGLILTAIIWSIIRDVNPNHTAIAHHQLNFGKLLTELLAALKNPQIWLNGMVGFLLYMSLSAFAELWGIPYLEQAQGLSKVHAAHANSMVFLGWAIGAPIWGWFSDFINRRRLPIIIGCIGALGWVTVLLYVPHLSIKTIYFSLFAFGLFSSAQILVFAICHEATQHKIAGTAIALTNMIVMIGGNIFQPFIGKLLDLGWKGELLQGARVYSIHDYQTSLSVLPMSIIIAFVLMSFIRETHYKIKKD